MLRARANPRARQHVRPGRGIALKIAATLVFALMSVCVKLVSERVPIGQVVFCRSFFALVPVVAVLLYQHQLVAALASTRPMLHVGRGIVGFASMVLSFMALARLPLPEAMMIGYAAPLIVVALSALLLHEPVRLYRWTATVFGFCGILIILWPRLSFLGDAAPMNRIAMVGAILGLGGALLSALTAIFIRSMTRTETTGSIVIYFSICGAVFGLMSLPLGWVVPQPADAFLLVIMGLLGGVGQLLMTASFRYAEAATVASFEYVSMLWGISFGYLFFAEVPSVSVIFGGAIVVAAGLFIIFRERRLGLQRARERRAARPTQI